MTTDAETADSRSCCCYRKRLQLAMLSSLGCCIVFGVRSVIGVAVLAIAADVTTAVDNTISPDSNVNVTLLSVRYTFHLFKAVRR